MNCAEVATLAPLYLAGELDTTRASAVVAHLQICPTCARDLDQQRDLDARLRSVLLAEEADARTLAPKIHRRIAVAEAKRRVLTLSLVAAGVTLVGGFMLYFLVLAHALPAVLSDAAQDHRREVIEKRVKKWRSDVAEIDALATRQGIPEKAIPALAAAGYRLDRARLCRLDGNIFLHLVYTDGEREMSVFLRPDKREPVPLRGENVGLEHVVAVQSGSMTVVCVAEESRAALSLAQSAAAAL